MCKFSKRPGYFDSTFCSLQSCSFYYPPGTTGNELGASDPVFMRKYGDELKNDSGKWIDSSVWHGKAHTWEKMPWLIKQVGNLRRLDCIIPILSVFFGVFQWKRISGGRPFVIKGIQSAEDALKAYEIGCEGIVVTNHAGRQVDGAVGSLEVLPEIVDAVGDSRDFLVTLTNVSVPSDRIVTYRDENYLRLRYQNGLRRVQSSCSGRTRCTSWEALCLGYGS